MRILQPLATRQLLAAVRPRSPFGARDHALIRLFSQTGLRVSEMVDVKPQPSNKARRGLAPCTQIPILGSRGETPGWGWGEEPSVEVARWAHAINFKERAWSDPLSPFVEITRLWRSRGPSAGTQPSGLADHSLKVDLFAIQTEQIGGRTGRKRTAKLRSYRINAVQVL